MTCHREEKETEMMEMRAFRISGGGWQSKRMFLDGEKWQDVPTNSRGELG